MTTSAVISECGTYRYHLRRVWDESKPRVAFCMLNGSTADALQNDPTITRCIGFGQSWANIKILFSTAGLIMAIGLTVNAATGVTHPGRIEYTILWVLLAIVNLNGLLQAILDKMKSQR